MHAQFADGGEARDAHDDGDQRHSELAIGNAEDEARQKDVR